MPCVICEKIKERKAMIAYEDDNLIVVLPSKPATLGHIKIMPKNHFTRLDELSDELVEELFFLANFSSSAVFEALKAHGTNIILTESDNHLAVDIIPRKDGDGLNFLWKGKQLSVTEMDEAYLKIKDKAFTVGKQEKKEEPKMMLEAPRTMKIETPIQSFAPAPVDAKKLDAKSDSKEEAKEEVLKIPKEDKTNYLIKHLQKIP
jgi:histidine triad (HIT) family protein